MNNSSTKATNKTNAKATTNKEVVTVMKDYLKQLQSNKNACIEKVIAICELRKGKNKPQAKTDDTLKIVDSLKACNVEKFLEVIDFATNSNVDTVYAYVTWYAEHKKALQQIVDKKNHTPSEKEELVIAYVNNRILDKKGAYKIAKYHTAGCKLLVDIK